MKVKRNLIILTEIKIKHLSRRSFLLRPHQTAVVIHCSILQPPICLLSQFGVLQILLNHIRINLLNFMILRHPNLLVIKIKTLFNRGQAPRNRRRSLVHPLEVLSHGHKRGSCCSVVHPLWVVSILG